MESSPRTPPHSLHSSRRSTEVAEITQLSTQPQPTIVAHLTKSGEPLVTLVVLLVVSAACSQRPPYKHCKHPQKPKLNPGTPTQTPPFLPPCCQSFGLFGWMLPPLASAAQGYQRRLCFPAHPRGKGVTIATCHGKLANWKTNPCQKKLRFWMQTCACLEPDMLSTCSERLRTDSSLSSEHITGGSTGVLAQVLC